MARLGRYFLPDQPLHMIHRGNNRAATFFAERASIKSTLTPFLL